jgi:hypothetical protein
MVVRADDAATHQLVQPEAAAPALEITQTTTNTDNDHLVNQAADPIARLLSVKIKFGWNNYHGPDVPNQPDDATSGQLQVVVPFSVWQQPNIMRITAPFQIDGRGDDGVTRVTVFDLLVFHREWADWGLGPLISVDTTGHSADRLALGPVLGFESQVTSKLKIGILNQNGFWEHTARSQWQPIIAYQLGAGWSLGTDDLQFTYDWNAGRWLNVPVGFQISKVAKIFHEPVNFGLSQQYNLVDTAGRKAYSISFSVTFLFPTLGHRE